MRNRFDNSDARFHDEHARRDEHLNYDDRHAGYGGGDYRAMHGDSPGHERGFGMANGRDTTAYDPFDRGGYETDRHYTRGNRDFATGEAMRPPRDTNDNRDMSWRRNVDDQRYGGRDAGMWSRYDYANDRGFHSLRSGGFNPDRSYGGNERYERPMGVRPSGYGAQLDQPRTTYGSGMGKPPKGYTRSDERIREDVCDRLGMDHDASDVEVKVEGGVVTLTGSVMDRETKYAIEEISERVSGVKDVQNQVTLQRGKASSLAETQRMESQRGVELGHMEEPSQSSRRKNSTQH